MKTIAEVKAANKAAAIAGIRALLNKGEEKHEST